VAGAVTPIEGCLVAGWLSGMGGVEGMSKPELRIVPDLMSLLFEP
jgi:hypothetical protein